MRTAPPAAMEAALADWLAQVQAVCPEQVLGACRFAPPRNEVAGRAAALGGGLALGWVGRRLARTVEAAGNKNRAGGLPSSFILVVTPTTVRVYESIHSRSGSEIGPEVAAWDRAALRVLNVDRGGKKTSVNLRLPDGDEIVCSAGTHDYTDRFVGLLTTAMSPAA
jgi:hypothetical protein